MSVLSRQVGPFPVGGWLAIGAAGIAAGLLARRWFAGGDSAPAAPVELVPQSSSLPLPDSSAPPPPPSGPPRDNWEWQKRAIEALTAEGQSPTLVQQALGRVLIGQEVTPQQAAIYNLAVRLVGPPPEPHPPIILVASDDPAPPPMPPDGDDRWRVEPVAPPYDPNVSWGIEYDPANLNRMATHNLVQLGRDIYNRPGGGQLGWIKAVLAERVERGELNPADHWDVSPGARDFDAELTSYVRGRGVAV